MKRDRRLMKQSFGINEWDFADLPIKISNLRLALVLHTLIGGGGYCFPDGSDTPNRHPKKNLRTWKFYRHRQFKMRLAAYMEKIEIENG